MENQPQKLQKNLSPDNKFRVIAQNQYYDENINPNIYQDYFSPKKQFSSMKILPNQNYNNFESYYF